jgi:hypothetical protein
MRTSAAILLSLALLGVWRATYDATCLGLIPAAVVVAVIAAAAREQAMRRRYCLAECWFREHSFPARFLRSGLIVTLRALAVSLFTGGFLLLSLLLWGELMLIVLALDSLILTALSAAIRSGSPRFFRPESHRVLVKSWSVGINTLLMAGILFYAQLYSPVPEYLTDSLTTTLDAASARVASSCPTVDMLAGIYQEKEAFAWWLMVQGSGQLDAPALRWTAWSIFLLSGTLGVWAYSRLMVQMIDFARGLEGAHDTAAQ